jgi:hypothetical protein
MYWCFARYSCRSQLAKQRLCEIVGCDHAFGMPLHADDPVRVARPFDCFDHSVGRVAHDAQISARAEHGLVMRAIYAGSICARHLREAGTRFERDIVMRFGAFMTGPGMLNLSVNFAGDILHQRTAEENVQALYAVTYCEDRFLFGDGVIEQREIGALASGVGIGGFRIAYGVKERRFDVGRAAGKDDCIESEREILQIFGNEAERDLDGLSAVRCDGFHILVIGIALVAKFFFFSAIRDAYTNFGGWGGAHEVSSYH